MKQIKKDELFEHLGGFLKSRGIELKEGSYAARIQQGCGLLTDVINVSQDGLKRAKSEAEKKLGQLRQVIHEKTAPKPAPGSAPKAKAAPSPAPPVKKAARRRTKKSRK